MALVNSVLPRSLLDLFSNDLILRHTSPYIGIKSLLSLAATSKAYYTLVYRTPQVFQHVNLYGTRALKGVESDDPIDDQRMNGLYAQRYRIIFTILENRNVLQHVRTLVLDELLVPSAIIEEILFQECYQIRLLSLRMINDWSTHDALRILPHLVRLSNGAPKLKGLYWFGLSNGIQEVYNFSNEVRRRPKTVGVTASVGAQLGAGNRMDDDLDDDLDVFRKQFGNDPYSDSPYGALGTSSVLGDTRIASEWPEILEACQGLIAFDAVLCRHDRESVPDRRPKLATVRLTGCHSCGTCPEGPAYPGVSPTDHIPLLSPPPLHSSKVEVAQRIDTNGQPYPPLILRCPTCLKDRWCERCNVWWCESCYTVPKNKGPTKRDPASTVPDPAPSEHIKVHNGLCVSKCLMDELLNGVGEGGMWG